jgi:voltage-gated potassium channel
MLGLSVFAAVVFYLHTVALDEFVVRHSRTIDLILLAGFTAELLAMLWVVDDRRDYLRRNWMSLFIMAALLAGSVLRWEDEFVGMFRLLRLTLLGLVMARVLHNARGLSPRSTPMLLMWSMTTVAACGVGLFWIDPKIESLGDGLWLAFVSASTVGYGDIVPSTTPGRLFAVVTILIGNAVLSLITASITAFFLNKEERERQKEMFHEVVRLRHQLADIHARLAGHADDLDVQRASQPPHPEDAPPAGNPALGDPRQPPDPPWG